MMFVLMFLSLLFAGCEADVQVNANQGPFPEQHTGPVTVTDINVGYCEPAMGEKSGTPVCDRSLTLKTDEGRLYTLGLSRSGQWPPVWREMRADIHFRAAHDWPHNTEIVWVQELPRAKLKRKGSTLGSTQH